MMSSDSKPEAIVVRTGLANVASIMSALERAGVAPKLSQDPQEVLDAPMAVLPGVGAFGAAMAELRRTRVDAAIIDRVALGRPLLAICLGLQVLCASSDESPGVPGLGIIPAHVTRLKPGPALRVPHLGWNTVTPGPGFTLAPRGMAYFANSYKLDEVPADGWTTCTSHHGGVFISALMRASLLACQFHPELSGVWGASLIRRWSRVNTEGPSCSAAV